MSYVFWIKRFVIATLVAFAILTAVELLKGHEPAQAVAFGLGWGALTGAIFTAAQIHHSRKGRRCAVCEDIPEPKE